MTEDERAVRGVVEQWMTATKAGDLDTVLGLIADDMLFMVPGQQPFGKQEFAAASRAMKGMQVDGRSDVLEVKVLGDWAYLCNYIDITITPPGAGPTRRTGYTLTILRKQPDGRWVLVRDANLVGPP